MVGIKIDNQINKYICAVFGEDCALALAVVHAENGSMSCTKDNTGTNRNGTTDRGLWQLNDQYHPYIPDCFKNTDKAFEIYQSRGCKFTAWSAYNAGKHKRFLNENYAKNKNSLVCG